MAARTCFTWYGFACGALPLQIDPLIHAALPEQVMAAPDALLETRRYR